MATFLLAPLSYSPTMFTPLLSHYVYSLYAPTISTAVEAEQFHHAVELGEKYEDFHVLVHLCEALGDKSKLQEYMAKFAAQGFSDFLFKQYLDKGKLKQLLSFSEDFPRQLSAFLEPHDSLSWLHHTATKEYAKVHCHCPFCVRTRATCILRHMYQINNPKKCRLLSECREYL